MIMKTNHNHPPKSSPSLNSNNINKDNGLSSSSSSTANEAQTTSQVQQQQQHNTNNTESSQSYIPTKLYVTNFPYTCTQRQIQELFSQYGQVVECTLKKDYYAYILFTSIKSALLAFKQANGLKMYGRKLTVHLATSKKSQSHLNHTNTNFCLNEILADLEQIDFSTLNQDIPKIVHVRNFPETCTQQQVKDLFTQYGDIVECLILHDSYAFVHFKSALDARMALQSTNNQPFMSSASNLLVQYSRSKFKQAAPPRRQISKRGGDNENGNSNNTDYESDQSDENSSDMYNTNAHEDFYETHEQNNSKNHHELNNSNATSLIRTKLYVTNFPEDMDQDEMKQLFNQYGQVLECTIMWNQYAFVHFGSYAEAEKALNAIKGSQYKGVIF